MSSMEGCFCTPGDVFRDIRGYLKSLPKKLYLYLFGLGMVIAIILLPLSIKRLESTEYGVPYDVVAKDVGGVEGEGLHVGPVGFEYVKFPAVYKTEGMNITCITKDGLFVDVVVSFQFLAERKNLETIVRKYRDYGKYRRIVRAAASSAVHFGCSQYLMDEYQSKRINVQATQFQELKARLTSLGALAVDLQLKNVDAPGAWSSAVQDKEKAREDIDLALNERQQQLIIANTTLNVARQVAQITAANASTQATVTLLQANATAEVLLNALKTEANTLADVKKALGLTVPGLLTYMANRALESKPELNLAISEPARFSYKDEL